MDTSSQFELSNWSRAFAEAVGKVEKSLVSIASGRWRTTGVAWNEPGVVLAPGHALEDSESVRLLLADGSEVKGEIAGRDPVLNLAVVKAEAKFEPIAWKPFDAVAVGHLALLVSRPRGSTRARLGMVSELGGAFALPFGAKVDGYLDVEWIGRGGGLSGVVATAGGEAVALHLSAARGRRSLNLPLTTLERVVPQLLAEGKVRRGYLGVVAHPVPLPKGTAEQEAGLLVLQVEEGSPAAQAGLVLGDVLISLFGQPVGGLQDLWAALGPDRVGQAGEAKILRAGKIETVTLTVGQRR